jgi:carbon monoxide dehydrogenase subunit G
MGISVQASYVIKRPIEEVFAFVSNFENSPLYGRTLKSTKVSDGPVSVGSIFHEVEKMMGRRYNTVLEVTEYDPPTSFSYTNRIGNMRERSTYTFEEVGEGTRTSFAGEAEMGKIGELLKPLFSRMMSRNVHTMVKSLKSVLESPDGPAV